MSDSQALAEFVGKWRGRWPEWSIAEVFVASAERETAVAWFALVQELTDAAWAGADPRPGEAKLGWWVEELLGWSQGRRRHPLGLVLQRAPAPWARLAGVLPSLLATRDAASTPEAARTGASPMAEAMAAVGACLFPGTAAAAPVEAVLARQLLLQADAAVPLQLRARLEDGAGAHAPMRAWAVELLESWPPAQATARTERIFAALLRNRLRRLAEGRQAGTADGHLSSLWSCWRAARG